LLGFAVAVGTSAEEHCNRIMDHFLVHLRPRRLTLIHLVLALERQLSGGQDSNSCFFRDFRNIMVKEGRYMAGDWDIQQKSTLNTPYGILRDFSMGCTFIGGQRNPSIVSFFFYLRLPEVCWLRYRSPMFLAPLTSP
jgi:hypothetical protein